MEEKINKIEELMVNPDIEAIIGNPKTIHEIRELLFKANDKNYYPKLFTEGMIGMEDGVLMLEYRLQQD